MSYLLDALKKSETERRVGQVPTLDTKPAAPPPPRHGRWLTGLAVALIIANGALLISLFLAEQDTDSTKKPPLPHAQIDQSATARTTSAPPQPDAKPSIKPPTADAPQSISEMIAAREEKKSPSAARIHRKTHQRPPADDTGNASPTAVNPPPEPQRTVSTPAQNAHGKTAHPENAPPAQPPVAALHPPPPRPRPPAEPVPLLRALPANVRSTLPAMTINVFVYSERVNERFVIINMHKYRTGDKIENGPVLESIRPDSAVLSYQGRRFRIRRP